VATGRFRVDGPFLKFERIATLPSARGKGVGKALMEAMQVAGYKKYPYHLPFMHSQSNVISFYEKLGWIPLGETFFEAGIPHRMMILPPKVMADLKKLKCLNDSKTPPVILSFLQRGSI
ncbi:MAG: GNAT family N-acetyltransferase, partial [Waddliaceae bacterium]